MLVLECPLLLTRNAPEICFKIIGNTLNHPGIGRYADEWAKRPVMHCWSISYMAQQVNSYFEEKKHHVLGLDF